MLKATTLKFLTDLKKNNNREWFAENKSRYEAAKDDFHQFMEGFIAKAAKIEPAYAQLEVKDCVFRIYRDVRFSKNKEPYKVNLSAQLKEGGKKSGKCGFYIHIEPAGNASFIAGGYWMPEAPVLKKLRQEVEYNTADFKAILNNKTFKKWYSTLEDHKLKKAPKGVDPTHPDIELLKYNSYVVTHPIDTKELTDKSLEKTLLKGLEVIKPFLDFLNTID
jgi:uncharacterized protein (TIGR02453 family)